jgi:energy-coupling factor transporter ATP-binding protein EcfA2
MHIQALGLHARVDAPGELHQKLERDWSRCLSTPPDDGSEIRFRVDTTDATQRDSQPYLLTAEITLRAIRELAGQRLAFHGCGLSDSSGRVVALIGASGAGKSTAAVTLASGSFGYVSDEVLAVDEDATVLPFPRPLAVRAARGVTGGKVQRGPDELHLLRCAPELTLARLVLLERERGRAGPPELEEVPMLTAMVELIAQTSALTALDRPLQRLCRLINICGGVVRLRYGEIEETSEMLHALLDSPQQRIADWSPIDDLVGQDGHIDGSSAHPRVQRGHVVDAVRTGEEALLLVGQQAVRLGPLGCTIWGEAGDSPTLTELVDRVVAAHGPHRDAAQVVRRAVDAMTAASVLSYLRPTRAE